MKRDLVFSNEAARHPFRQRLPRHVFKEKTAVTDKNADPRADDEDWKLFLLSFAAFFTVAYTFIF